LQLDSEKAYHLIKEKIITLELAPSSVIDEHTLMEDLGLGRTPIREALRRLAAENLVNVIPRRGTFVADIRITDLQGIFEVRMVLAGFCARLAAQRIGRDQIAHMGSVLERLERLEELQNGNPKALMVVDRRFQRLLYQAADNRFLADTLNQLYDLSLRMWYLVLDRLGGVEYAIEQHWGVLDALKAGDEDRAETLIRQHIAQFQQRIKSVL